MAIAKRQTSNAMLYTLIAFIGLFVAATIIAVIYYINFEEQRTIAETAQKDLEGLVSGTEQRKGLGMIIGTRQPPKSWLGSMVDYFDEVTCLIVGGLPEDTSAEAKTANAVRKVKETLELLAQEHIDIETIDPNTTGLIAIIGKLKIKLDNTINEALAAQERLDDLQKLFDDAKKAGFEKEQTLLAEKEEYQQQVDKIKRDYEELEAFMTKTKDEQVKTLMAQRDESRDNYKQENEELLKTRAELTMAEERIEYIQERLQAIMAPPDREVAISKPDGKIILVDDQAKPPVVHLNIGTDDHVYRGLTFSVYDRNMPIPRDGRGKAEIEVFGVEKNFSAARITKADKKRPIVLDDIVANLIWDSDKTNLFVVAGDFDLDGDGGIDYGAVDKINGLIEKWGGRVADNVSVETDFVVLGSQPRALARPSLEEIDVRPMAMEEYEASQRKHAHYEEVESQAKVLWIPVLNGERFLYLIGYKAQATRAGAF